jgi:hypothetical protein
MEQSDERCSSELNAEYALKESLVQVARPEYLRAELTI